MQSYRGHSSSANTHREHIPTSNGHMSSRSSNNLKVPQIKKIKSSSQLQSKKGLKIKVAAGD